MYCMFGSYTQNEQQKNNTIPVQDGRDTPTRRTKNE